MKTLYFSIALFAILPSFVCAEPVISPLTKIGTEILVNSQTLYDQTLAQSAKLNDGGFVTVWTDWADSGKPEVADGSWSGIKAQVFSSKGTKMGKEILVNTATTNWQQDPKITVLLNGNFVVTWTDGWDYFSYADHPGSLGVGGATGDKEGKAVKAQVFSSDGSPIGTEILVNTEPRSSQAGQKITSLNNGNFVVVWENWSTSCVYDADGSLNRCGGGPDIRGQLFNPSGAKVGSEFNVTSDYSYTPQITSLTGGGFVVVWQDGHYSVEDIKAQVFSESGTKVGSALLVNTSGTGATFSTQHEAQVVGISNNGFAVTWTDKNGDDSSSGVKSQTYDSKGTPIGKETLVNTTTAANQYHPQITALKNGGFVISWDNWATDIDVNAQLFDNSGTKIGSEIVASTVTGGSQDGNRISPLIDGGFAISWAEGWTDIKFQVFDAAGTKVGTDVLANTTIAGGQSGAQITSLDTNSFVVAWNDDLYGPSDGSGGAVKAQIFGIGVKMLGEECFFNWAETHFSALFSPAASTQTLTPYNYRYYKNTNAYLGVSSTNHHIYYLTPKGELLDAGETASWYKLANCQLH